MYLIKFGGSIITEKSNTNAVFRKSVMNQLAKELKLAEKDYIIVHGAGSFGHVLSEKYNLNDGLKSDDQRIGFSMTQTLVQKLNMHMLKSLQLQGLPSISIPPHATMTLNNHQQKDFNEHIYKMYLLRGFIPVTFGDVVLDDALGFSICSGDLLMEILTKVFDPEKVIFIIDEDGLFWENPKINPKAEFIDKICYKDLQQLNTKLDDHADVTGGMKGKVDTIERIVSYNINVFLLNGNKAGRLYDVLVGKDTKSTLIYR